MLNVGQVEVEQDRIGALLRAGVRAPSVLCWHHPSPAIVLGRGQRPSPDLVERAGREHLPLVGRASGGGAVIAGPWMLSLTLLLPAAHAIARASLPAGYHAVGAACHRALAQFGFTTRIATDPSPASRRNGADPLDWACFASVSHGELLAGGARKIVGIAQVRRRDVVAVCMGVLLSRPDWATLVRVWLGHADEACARGLDERTASCDRVAHADDVPPIDALAAAFEQQLLAA
jgi:lipoate---protein ligase